MKNINILKTQQIVNYIIFALGILIIFISGFRYLSFIFIFTAVLAEIKRRKSYFHYNDNKLIWKFPDFQGKKSLQLEGDNYKVTSDWKGIVLKNESNEHSISLDGLWKNDKKHILKKLQEFYG